MAKPAIKIELVKIKDLLRFTERALTQRAPDEWAPISRSRAEAWARNPQAQPDDVALLAAYRDGACVGHLGFVANMVRVGEVTEKLFWLSAYFVPREERETGVGAMLMMRAMALGTHLGVSGASEEGEKIYRALRFGERPSVEYLFLNVNRLNAPGVPLRLLRRLLKRMRIKVPPLDRGIALTQRMTRWVLYTLLLRGRPLVTVRELAQPPDRLPSPGDHPHFVRGAEMIRWTMRHPWVVTDRGLDTPNYQFDDYRQLFQPVFAEVEHAGQQRASVFLTVCRHNEVCTLKVLDVFPLDTSALADVLTVTVRYARKFGADRIELPIALERAASATRLFRGCFARKRRVYFVQPKRGPSALASAVDDLKIDYCDGDLSYT